MINNNEPLMWRTTRRKVNDLVPYNKNPRVMSADQESNLKKSLERFNLVEIPAIDTDNKIIAGHQRLKVMQILGRGDEEIDVRIPNRRLTKEEYERYLLTSNAVTGDWNYESLKDFEIGLLTDSGFSFDDIANIWDGDISVSTDDWDEKKELAKIKVPKTKIGDLVTLGDHRLICGSSNEEKTLSRLFGYEKADTIFSDPIYNLKIKYNKGVGGKKDYGGNVNDDRTEKEYIEFLRKNISTALLFTKPDSHIFYWNTEQQIWIIQSLYRELGITNRRVCLWIKNAQNETPQVAFSKCYEPCIYGTLGKPYLSKKEFGQNEIMNVNVGSGNKAIDDINIWTSKRVSGKEMEHATQKPVDLYEKAIRRCTKPGDIILDSFGGSGSLLIACEKLKRKAYLVELEPIYCDLIIARYEKLTGQKAKVESI